MNVSARVRGECEGVVVSVRTMSTNIRMPTKRTSERAAFTIRIALPEEPGRVDALCAITRLFSATIIPGATCLSPTLSPNAYCTFTSVNLAVCSFF